MILAELTGEVAPDGGNRIGARSGKEVKERFLLDRIYTTRHNASVNSGVENAIAIHAHVAQASLPSG